MTRTGRRPGESEARERILRAAREAFGARGLDGATIRAIGASAGVDPALVHHYFGTKERLFVAAIELPFDPATVLPGIQAGPPEEVGHRLVRFFCSLWEAERSRDALMGIFRSAVTDPRAAEIVRALIVERAARPLAEAIGKPEPALRATLVGSQLVGLAVVRYVVRVEPLASAPVARVVEAIGPTIQRYLAGSLERDDVLAGDG